ncbi:hypothetical protein CGLO_14336 [Colletotrichum gloeosporioides Cg-14]|uniref:Uncharacterized protein n=1 Tax=Colletotrichum gloeosporioides (strain Cg-14) TaxID=1237896 RepID=T0LE22_COLGC|nr:hypothetical protein CGLO_14336 [Colletotrichum gloeosporioides Cg-14]
MAARPPEADLIDNAAEFQWFASETAITSPANKHHAVTAFLFTATAQKLQSVTCTLHVTLICRAAS